MLADVNILIIMLSYFTTQEWQWKKRQPKLVVWSHDGMESKSVQKDVYQLYNGSGLPSAEQLIVSPG